MQQVNVLGFYGGAIRVDPDCIQDKLQVLSYSTATGVQIAAALETAENKALVCVFMSNTN